MKTNDLPKEIFLAACKFNLLNPSIGYSSRKITDGVSSDIWHVKTQNKKEFCIKRALGKLAVKEDWFAPVDRNNFEAMYFNYCNRFSPDCFPNILGHDKKNYILAMEWFNEIDHKIWKSKLLKKKVDLLDAKNISTLLSRKHKFFFNKNFFKKKFENDKTFFAIRIEPYIIFTSKKYPDYKKDFIDVAQSLVDNKKTLIHGDFSPKNILIKSNNPIILDAETACWGDPVFDLAFCNNHLLLKSFLPNYPGKDYIKMSYEFINNYISNISWEDKSSFIERFIKILPLLLLARIDGKSPVEYFSQKEQRHTRDLAKYILDTKVNNIIQLYSILYNHVKK